MSPFASKTLLQIIFLFQKFENIALQTKQNKNTRTFLFFSHRRERERGELQNLISMDTFNAFFFHDVMLLCFHPQISSKIEFKFQFFFFQHSIKFKLFLDTISQQLNEKFRLSLSAPDWRYFRGTSIRQIRKKCRLVKTKLAALNVVILPNPEKPKNSVEVSIVRMSLMT